MVHFQVAIRCLDANHTSHDASNTCLCKLRARSKKIANDTHTATLILQE